jgi:competence protein ComGC
MKTQMTLQKTIANSYGEEIHIKIVNGQIFIHHEDATKDFISINDLFIQIYLNAEEVILISGAIRSLTSGSNFYTELAQTSADLVSAIK